MGKSGRMATMLPKWLKVEPGEYEMEIVGVDTTEPAEVPVEAVVEAK